VRGNDSLGSDRSSSSSSVGINAEEDEDDSGTVETCQIRGDGDVEGESQVKVEAEGFFASDNERATDDSPQQYSGALPVVNFDINADYSFASHSGDFDLFEGGLLNTCDEIFVTPSKEDGMKR
jgi:hypothetical protein